MKIIIRIFVLFVVFLIETQRSDSQCITWANNVQPSTLTDSAMEVLCSYQIIANTQNAALLSNPITRNEVARCLGKVVSDIYPLTSTLDNFPSIYPDLPDLSVPDQRYFKIMLFLEYQDGISPFSRNSFYINPNNPITRSDAVKALIETWNLPPYLGEFNPASTAFSSRICDMQVSNKNLPWIEEALPLGLLFGLTQPCGTNLGVLFGTDGNISYSEFYVMLARLLGSPAPTISPADFFIPNLFDLRSLNTSVGIEKGVFQEYSGNGFSIPSGGLPLEFEYSYHSSFTEIPVLINDNDTENIYVKRKLQPLGGGWTHSYSTFITYVDNNASEPDRVLIYWPDGTVNSFLVAQNKYETLGITDKLSIDSFNNQLQPTRITITKGRTVYLFRNIDPTSFNILSLVQITDAHNNTLTFGYKDGYSDIGLSPKLLSTVSDSYSKRSLVFTYDAKTNYLISVTDPIGRFLTFYVNQYTHELDSAADAKNEVTKYNYSNPSIGSNIPSDYRAHLLSSIQRPNGNYITNTYFSRKLNQTQTPGYVIQVAAVPNYTQSWTQQTSQISATRGTQTLTTNFTFNVLGSVINASTQTDSIENQFDANNRLILARDWTLGFITTYGYDSSGYLNSQVVTDSLFADSIKYVYTNNGYGEATRIDDYNDINDRVTTITRNPQGDPTFVSVSEVAGNPITYQYTYNNNGLLFMYASPTSYYTEYDYNNFGNVNKVYKYPYPAGGALLSESFGYDGASRETSHTDYNGNITSYTYDSVDNLTSVIQDPGGLNLATVYKYDANTNHVLTISPRGNTTTLTYDFNTDDLIAENDGINGKRWKYNTDGSLDSFITKRNIPFGYLYYNQSLYPGTTLTGLLFSDGITNFQYQDKTKNLYHVNNSYGKENYFKYGAAQRGKWNKPNDVSTEGFFNGIPDDVIYSYDRLGRPLSTIYPTFGTNGHTIIDTYDFTTRNLATVSDNNTQKIYVTYSYQKDGQPLNAIYGNGDTIFYHYDVYDRLDSMWGKNSNNQLLYSIGASLDNNGNHIRENTQIFYNGQQVATAPAFGFTPNTSYTYEPTRNRMLSAGNNAFTSDGSGNITASTDTSTTNYSWNEYEQLISCYSNVSTINYGYDALGNRKQNGQTYYVVDQQNTGNVIMELTPNFTPLNIYVYGNGLVARIDPQTNNAFYYHYDFRGSVIAITDQNGQLVQYYQYDAYGAVYNTKAGALTWANPFQYVGKEGVQTDANGLCYMKARYYQPSTGRFLGEDPVWNTNLFVYAADDPINNIDPNGRTTNYLTNILLDAVPDVLSLINGVKVGINNASVYLSNWGGNQYVTTVSTSDIFKVIGGLNFLKTASTDIKGLNIYGRSGAKAPGAVSPASALSDAALQVISFADFWGTLSSVVLKAAFQPLTAESN